MKNLVSKVVIVSLAIGVLVLVPTTYLQAQDNRDLERRVASLEQIDKEFLEVVKAQQEQIAALNNQLATHSHY